MTNVATSAYCFLVINVAFVLSVSVTIASPRVQSPEPIAADSLVNSLLETHWDKNKENRAESTTKFDASVGNRRTLLAYTLNRMHHNRQRDALRVAESLTKQYPDEVDGWVLRIWIDAVTKDFDRVLVDLNEWKKANDKSKRPANSNVDRMSLQMIGQLVGFMQGPILNRVDENALENAVKNIVVGLGPKQRKLFHANRERSLAKFKGYVAKRVVQKAKEGKVAEEAKVKEKNILESEIEQLDTQADKIAPRIQSVRDEGTKRISLLQDQLIPLERNAAYINAQINMIAYDLVNAYSSINRVQRASFRNNNTATVGNDCPRNGGFIDPLRNYNLLSLRSYVRNREFERAALANRYSGTVLQIGSLESELLRTSNEYSFRVRAIEQERGNINRTRRRSLNKMKKLAKRTFKTSNKLTAISSREKSLTTYAPFPVEAFKEHLLADVAK